MNFLGQMQPKVFVWFFLFLPHLASVQVCESFAEQLDSVINQSRLGSNRLVRVRHLSTKSHFADRPVLNHLTRKKSTIWLLLIDLRAEITSEVLARVLNLTVAGN